LLTLWLPDPEHAAEASLLCATLIGTYAARQLQERGVRGRLAWEEVKSREQRLTKTNKSALREFLTKHPNFSLPD
jgi:hypothetical protein